MILLENEHELMMNDLLSVKMKDDDERASVSFGGKEEEEKENFDFSPTLKYLWVLKFQKKPSSL